MKKLTIYLAVLLVITTVSCTKNFTKINTNPSSFTSAEPAYVLPGVFYTTLNRFALTNIQNLWEYGHQVQVQGRYNPGADDNWNKMYVNVLGNTVQLKKLFKDNPAYANTMAITDIWECYVYAFLVGTYGPCPYSHMGDTSNPYVLYDDENTIYTSLLSRLKADAAALKTTGDKFTSDPIYGGDMTKWAKFANSLRLRIALTVQKNLPDLAVANIKELMASESTLFTSDADDPKFNYGTASGSQSQYNVSIVQSTSYLAGSAPTMSDYIFTWFRSYKDPRLDAYFAKATTPFSITDTLTSTADNKHYIVSYPIPHLGQAKSTATLPNWTFVTPTHTTSEFPLNGNVANGNFSTPQPILYTATRPFYIMTYAELCFMKAEAALLGYGGTQTADQYYYAGINANFAFWGLSQAQATAYQTQDGIRWSSAGKGFYYDVTPAISTSLSTDNFKKIWLQQWLNYYDDGMFEAWLLQRRTQNLPLPPHTTPGLGLAFTPAQNLPDRFPYPVTETANNPQGYASGLKFLGGTDFQATRLVFEPNYTAVDWTKVSAYYDISYVQKWYGTTIQATQAAIVPAANFKIINSY
ncbi:MAG: SusD/RagB family nutrient-binding outer membrane lipoprotein [Bacteroidota bacterium]